MEAGETVAVLGAGGTMGQPMARNIAQAGIGVRAWNRSHSPLYCAASPTLPSAIVPCEPPVRESWFVAT